jgi:hypothetical protein
MIRSEGSTRLSNPKVNVTNLSSAYDSTVTPITGSQLTTTKDQ